MAQLFDTEFIDISITVFLKIAGHLPFDVYVKRGDNTYTKLFPKGEVIDQSRLKGYQTGKGVDSLFVHKGDYRQYLFYVEDIAKKFFENTSKVPVDEMVEVLNEMINLTMLEIVVNVHIDEKSVNQAMTSVRGSIKVLAQDPKSLAKVLQYLTRHPYTIKHSIATSIFSIMLARQVKLESDKALMIVGIGALLHDVGMAQLPFDAESKTELTAQEWKDVKEHPQIGKRLLDGIKNVSSEAKSIVLQHHEQPNGMGYPNGLHDKDIYLPAKIVSIADSFSALISKRPYREETFSPLKALELMDEDRGKFDNALLTKFFGMFVNVKTTK